MANQNIIEDIKNQIIAIAMLNFGMRKYRIQEGYSEWMLLELSYNIAEELGKTDFIKMAIAEDDFRIEAVQDKVDEYIKEA